MARNAAGGVSSLRIRRRLARLGIPVLDINARTASEKVKHQREKLVDELIGEAQVEVLRALASGALSIELVEAHKRERGLAGASLLTHVQLRVPFVDALTATLPGMATGRTLARYETSAAQLRGRVGGVAVRDLPSLPWAAWASEWPNSASDWMHVRRLLSRFLSVYLNSKHHPFRHEVLARVPLKTEAERTSELTPAQFLVLVEKARADIWPVLWTLVLTGMRVGEYLRCTPADLRPAIHAVAVPGTKTAGSRAHVRVDPKLWHHVVNAIPAPLAYKRLRELFKEALEKADLPASTRLHDLRHAHGQWAIDGGAAEALVQVSLRHTQAATTRRYTKQKGRADVATALAKTLTKRGG